jgi:hypothetical protein
LVQVVEGGFFNFGFGHAVVTHGLGALSFDGAGGKGL